MAANRLRIVSYNIQALLQGADGVIATLSALAPDLIALQEVDEATVRSGKVLQAKRIAEALQLHCVYAAAVPYQGGEFGLAILGRGELTDVHIERLPHAGEEEPRIAMLATCHLPGGQAVRLANTHLAADWRAPKPAELRAMQAEALMRVLRAEAELHEPPLFLAGDFNCESDSEAMAHLRLVARALHEDLPTYPATAPHEALDHVLYVPGARVERYRVEVIEVRVEASTASDHRPLVVDIELVQLQTSPA